MTVAHFWFDNQIVEADTTEDQTGKKLENRNLMIISLIRSNLVALQEPKLIKVLMAGHVFHVLRHFALALNSKPVTNWCRF